MNVALAVVFLVFLAAALAVAVWRAAARTEYTAAQYVLWIIARLFTRLLWRARLPRRLPFASGQGAVIVCNHRSSVDPFFVQCCAPRPVHWMVAREYCEHPAFRWLARTCAVIPVNRGGIDTQSTKMAIRLASQGELVGMLPEGRINMSDQFMLPVRPGAVLVALKARVPILPCYIDGAPYAETTWSPFLMTARTRLLLGGLMDLSPYYGREQEEGVVEQLTREVAREIARLAERPDFEPQIAGRQWKPTREELDEAVAQSRARRKGGAARRRD